MPVVKKKRHLIFVGAVAVFCILVVGRIYYQAMFPFGQSHCCITAMALALEQYASENAGCYPKGGLTPEASLSLLYKSDIIDPYTLRGMTISETVVRHVLESGGLLGADTCGWQYVDGLAKADDTRIALLYCKQALGHNGEKRKDGGRQVFFVGGNIEMITADKWPGFLQEQKRLLSQHDARATNGSPP